MKYLIIWVLTISCPPSNYAVNCDYSGNKIFTYEILDTEEGAKTFLEMHKNDRPMLFIGRNLKSMDVEFESVVSIKEMAKE